MTLDATQCKAFAGDLKMHSPDAHQCTVVRRDMPRDMKSWGRVVDMDEAPLVLTLQLDGASFAFFNAARQLHFPAERNHIPAHLTLFHHLPGARLPDVEAVLETIAAGTSAFRMRVMGLRFLGFGSAYEADSEDLIRLRSGLASKWQDHLTRQDAQPFRPHITIQNKVGAADAKALYADLCGSFEAFDVKATGLLLWRYRGGPWEFVREFRFVEASVSRLTLS